MMKLQQINRQFVKKIHIPNEDTRPIKGFDICEEVYANIVLFAKKKSGKTSTLAKIMKECINKETIIYLFCSTAYKDKNWIQIRKKWAKKGREVHVFTSIFDGGRDQLAHLIEDLKRQAEEDEKEQANEYEDEESLPPMDPCDAILMKLGVLQDPDNEHEEEEEEKVRKPRASKYLAPEYVIIFDDLSSELKSKTLLSFLKFNRHYKSKVIISSQWPHDLLPESRKQIDLFLIFKGFPEAKLQKIYEDCDSGVPFDRFFQMYEKATEKPHSFFYIDTRADKFRRNFDCQFLLDE